VSLFRPLERSEKAHTFTRR